MADQKRQKFRKTKVGTGITQRDAWQSGEIVDEESKQAHDDLLKRFEKTKGLLSERATRAAVELNGGPLSPPTFVPSEETYAQTPGWYALAIKSCVDGMSVMLRLMNSELGTKLNEQDLQGVLGQAYELGRLTREAEIKFEWEPLTLKGKKFAESKRGRSELYRVIEQLLKPGDSNSDLVRKLYDQAGAGGTILEIEEDDHADLWVIWRTRDGAEKKTSVKSVSNMAAEIRKKTKK